VLLDPEHTQVRYESGYISLGLAGIQQAAQLLDPLVGVPGPRRGATALDPGPL
jgi:hypothetical protein